VWGFGGWIKQDKGCKKKRGLISTLCEIAALGLLEQTKTEPAGFCPLLTKNKKANPHAHESLAQGLPPIKVCPFCGAIESDTEDAPDFITY